MSLLVVPQVATAVAVARVCCLWYADASAARHGTCATPVVAFFLCLCVVCAKSWGLVTREALAGRMFYEHIRVALHLVVSSAGGGSLHRRPLLHYV